MKACNVLINNGAGATHLSWICVINVNYFASQQFCCSFILSFAILPDTLKIGKNNSNKNYKLHKEHNQQIQIHQFYNTWGQKSVKIMKTRWNRVYEKTIFGMLPTSTIFRDFSQKSTTFKEWFMKTKPEIKPQESRKKMFFKCLPHSVF